MPCRNSSKSSLKIWKERGSCTPSSCFLFGRNKSVKHLYSVFFGNFTQSRPSDSKMSTASRKGKKRARVNQRHFCGKTWWWSSLHSTTIFSENAVVAETSYQNLSTQQQSSKIQKSVSVIKDCLTHIPFLSSFPLLWKKAEVVSHPRNGDRVSCQTITDQSQSRLLIELTNKSRSKVSFTTIQFLFFPKRKKNKETFNTKHQSGNMKDHSTLRLLVTDHLLKAIDDEKVTAAVLIDLNKSFNSISHATRLNKLPFLGTSRNTQNWFQSYLTDREKTTRIYRNIHI